MENLLVEFRIVEVVLGLLAIGLGIFTIVMFNKTSKVAKANKELKDGISVLEKIVHNDIDKLAATVKAHQVALVSMQTEKEAAKIELAEKTKEFIEKVKEKAEDVKEKLSEKIRREVQEAIDVEKKALEEKKENVKNDIKDTITNAIEKAKEIEKAILDKIKEKTEDVSDTKKSDVNEKLEELKTGLEDKMEDLKEKIETKLKDVDLSDIKNSLKNLFNKK